MICALLMHWCLIDPHLGVFGQPLCRAVVANQMCENCCTGQAAAGTPHLLLGVMTCGNAAVNKVLKTAGIEIAAFTQEVSDGLHGMLCQHTFLAVPAPETAVALYDMGCQQNKGRVWHDHIPRVCVNRLFRSSGKRSLI